MAKKEKKKSPETLFVRLNENATVFSDPKTGFVIRNREIKEIPSAWNQKPTLTKEAGGKKIKHRNRVFEAIKSGYLEVVPQDEAQDEIEETAENTARTEAIYRHENVKFSAFKNKDSFFDYIKDNYGDNFTETETWEELKADDDDLALSDLTKKQLEKLAKDCHDNLPIPGLEDDDDEDDAEE